MQHQRRPDCAVPGAVRRLPVRTPPFVGTALALSRPLAKRLKPSLRTGMLLLAVLAAGCAPGTVAPAIASPIAPGPSAPPTATHVAPSPTPLPTAAPEASPTATTMAAPTLSPGHLISHWTASPPTVDGEVDDAWAGAESLRASLTWGIHGTEHAIDVELRALHTAQSIYLLAQWAGQPPSGEADTTANKFTMHWPIPDAAARHLDCNVACHTAFADGEGRFVYANAETIPQGGSEALPAAGRWEDGVWTLEWSRPLLDGNPFDLQFDDLDARYTFMVKVFEGIEGRPDPVSERYTLVFEQQ
jgi:hypothetical protein